VYLSVQLRRHEQLLEFKDVIISVVNGFLNRDKDLSCRLLLPGDRYTVHFNLNRDVPDIRFRFRPFFYYPVLDAATMLNVTGYRNRIISLLT